jgi:hypothetical protein
VLQVLGRELKQREVETALSNLTQVEVKSGVALNDTVAIASTNGKPIGDGTKVKF